MGVGPFIFNGGGVFNLYMASLGQTAERQITYDVSTELDAATFTDFRNIFVWCRLRVDASGNFEAWYWNDGDTPKFNTDTPDLTATSTSRTSGTVGIGFDSNNLGVTVADIDIFGVGTNGDAAPITDPSAGGGAEESLTEALALAEAVNAVVAVSESVQEGLTLSEAINAKVDALSSTSETLALTDAVVSTVAARVVVLEGVSYSEAKATTVDVLGLISEEFSLSETTNVIDNSGNVTDILALTDTVRAVVQLKAQVQETLVLSDVLAVSAFIRESLAEGYSITEAVAATIGLTGQVSEQIQFADQQTAEQVFSASVIESFEFTDHQGNIVAVGGVINETISLGESTTSEGGEVTNQTGPNRLVAVRAGARIVTINLGQRIIVIED